MDDLDLGPDASADGPALAPPVVAVVVAHDPGPWFEEVLQALAAQDYSALEILIVDAGSETSVTPRVAPILPRAYVRRIEANPGYGPAANEVLEVVEGASFFLFCHDDVALAPSAVSTLVEEAYRSNGAIVGPKLVRFDQPERLVGIGLAVDKTGVPAPLVERGELDQEQHDAVRDVFAVSSACLLVRSDLFGALGGFDDGIDFFGEDVDLCWRAQLAGARVLIVPTATARHREAIATRMPAAGRRRLEARHRLRTMLSCYRPLTLLRVLPQAALIALLEVVYALASGRLGEAREIGGAWPWNLRRLGDIAARRRALDALRKVPDSEVRRLQVGGSARLAAFFRGQIGRSDDRFGFVTRNARDLVAAVTDRKRRAAVVVWMVVVVVLVFGSRSLITNGAPAIGDLPSFHHGIGRLVDEWRSGWRSAGVGSESPAPTGFVLLAGAGALVFGAVGLLRTLLVVGLLPIGAVGAWRVLGDGGRRARLACLLVYMAIPLPYNAIAHGRWSALAVWAAIPYAVRRLGRLGGLAPMVSAAGAGGATHAQPFRSAAFGLGVLVAVVGAFVPSFVLLVPFVALALVVGGAVAGDVRGAGRIAGGALLGSAVAAVLHIPWTFDFLLPGSQWSAIGGVRTAEAGITWGGALRFETGPIGAPPLGWAVLAPAVLPLLIGREWRATWAVRAWILALSSWALAWGAGHPGFPLVLPEPEVLLAPAALGVAMAAGLGMAAFTVDLRGYHFGWRQLASVVAAGGLAIAFVPIVGASWSGRWKAPSGGFDTAAGFLDSDHATDGPYRVLWLGDPSVLPLAGWRLADGVAYATTDEGTPTVEDRWAGSSDGPTELLADAVRFATGRDTSRLGRLLAPMGVRYVAVALAADPFREDGFVEPPGVLTALDDQLDLSAVSLPTTALRIYRNEAWTPTRALFEAGTVGATGSGFFTAASAIDLSRARAGAGAGLPRESGFTGAIGPVEKGTDLYLGSASSSRWHMSVDGQPADRRKAFGWANAFTIDSSGTGVLTYDTSPLRTGMLLVQAGLWLVVIRIARRSRPRGADA